MSVPYGGFPTRSAMGPTHQVWLIHRIANTVPTMKTKAAAKPYGNFLGSCQAEMSYAYPRLQIICSKKMMVKKGVSQYAMTFKKFSMTEDK